MVKNQDVKVYRFTGLLNENSKIYFVILLQWLIVEP